VFRFLTFNERAALWGRLPNCLEYALLFSFQMHPDLSKDLLHQSLSRIEWSGEIQTKKR
jgi:hypothetical protein